MVLSPLSKFINAPTAAPVASVSVTFCGADVLLMGTENFTLTTGLRFIFLNGKNEMPFIVVET